MTLQNSVKLWSVTLVFVTTVDDLKHLEGVFHENDLSLGQERKMILIGAGIIISEENVLEIVENPAVPRASNQQT